MNRHRTGAASCFDLQNAIITGIIGLENMQNKSAYGEYLQYFVRIGMDEGAIKRQLRRITISAAVSGILLLVCGSIFWAYLMNSLNQTVLEQMQTETAETKRRIENQMSMDFQVLETLAVIIGYHNVMESAHFAEAISEANQHNAFDTMCYFPLEGNGVLATLGHEVEMNMPIERLNANARSVIQQSFQGERAISRLFDSMLSQEKVFVYSVPVYVDGEIAGALAASDHIDIFTEILAADTVLGGGGYLHLLGSEGRFLIRSNQSVVKDGGDTIFDGTYIQESEKEKIRQAMARQEALKTSFQYEGKEYLCYLEPVGVNGWYIFCVNTRQWANASVYRMLNVVGILAAGLLALVVVFLSYGYRLMRRNNKELLYPAYHDPVTGANNFPAFTKSLEGSDLRPGTYYVAAINIYQFKFVNELFGKEQGDNLLRFVKQVLEGGLKKEEFFCREAGDLFYLCLRESDKETVRRRLETMMDRVSTASLQDGHNYRVLLYCGAVAGGSGSIMTHVLFALARAKEIQRNAVWFYDEELHKKEELENYMETHMHQALQDGEFKLFLQPKMDLHTGKVGGAEALVRWITSDGTFLFPGDFIPLFEENGFCTRLDMYMVECVCRQIRQWMDDGIQPIPISVNQSKLLFYETDYITRLWALVEKYQIPAQLITLEILEGLAVNNMEEMNRKIELLQQKGFRVSMDDFGSGYSSLNTLCNLRINELKLDRGFLMQTTQEENEKLRMIMEHIVQLSQSLHISTVVEGVETQENEALIQSLGCDYGQGYFYSKPIDAAAFSEKYMKKQ